MRKNITKVLQAWFEGVAEDGDGKATCSHRGGVVYSYALPIMALRSSSKDPNDVYVVANNPTFSHTTRSHVAACEAYLNDKGWTYKKVPHVMDASRNFDHKEEPVPVTTYHKPRFMVKR